MSESTDWFYTDSGERIGPVSPEIIIDLINKGSIQKDCLIWNKSFQEWKQAVSTEFSQHFQNDDIPPSLPGEAVQNNLVWALAFAPLAGLFLQGMVAGATNSHIDDFWFITIILNVALSEMDAKKLKKAGHNVSNMGMAWLIPVYLFKRAKNLKQNPAYFYTWCTTFVLSCI